jgi:hypothetical protein
MGGTLMPFVVTPHLLIDGVGRQDLSAGLQSVVIHALDGDSDARIEVSGQAGDVFPRGYATGMTEVAVRFDEHKAFSGKVGELELRAPEGGPTSLLLVATGTAHTATTRRAVRVRYGNELVSLSVRRRADRTRARGVLTSLIVHCDTRLRIDAPDPEFDGVFTVVELWHTFDTGQGARIEFLAEA